MTAAKPATIIGERRYTMADVFVCHGDCGRMTRPNRMRVETCMDEKGNLVETWPRYSSTMCQRCRRKSTGYSSRPKLPEAEAAAEAARRLESTTKALDGFMAERAKRLAAARSRRRA